MKYLSIIIALMLSTLWLPVQASSRRAGCLPSVRGIINQNVWVKTYGGDGSDHLNGLATTDDGGYIITGSTHSFGSTVTKMWNMRLDSQGSVVWEKSIDFSGPNSPSEWAYSASESIKRIGDNYLIAGWAINKEGVLDAVLLKINREGSVTWQKYFTQRTDDLALYSTIPTHDGGFLALGINHTSGYTWIIRFDANGEVVWEEKTTDVLITNIIEQSDGNLLMAGTALVNHGGYESPDGWLGLFTSEGVDIWQKTYGGNFGEEISQVLVIGTSGYFVIGYTDSFGAGSHDGWLMKVGPNGTMEWQKAYGGNGSDGFASIYSTMDGNLLVAGTSGSFGNGSSDIWIMKLSGTGEIVWQKYYGAELSDIATDIRETPDGGIIIGAGTNSVGAGGYDILIMKLDHNGDTEICNWAYGGSAEVHSNPAFVENKTALFESKNTDLVTREYTITDTTAESSWICPNAYRTLLPYVIKD